MRYKAIFIISSILLVHQCLLAQPGFGEATKINENWLFALGSKNDSNILFPPAGVPWQPVDLPHDWSVKQKLNPANASSMGYLPGGIGWYKKNLVVPDLSKRIYLCFEGVYNRSEVFVNGQSVGKRPNGYISFLYDITPFVQANKPNEILVRVNHSHDADSRWYTGSGIYRDVWLVRANPVHIAPWGVYAYPEMQAGAGLLNVEVSVKNTTGVAQPLTIMHELIDTAGKVAASQSGKLTLAAGAEGKAKTTLKVNNPKLWGLSNPQLYTLKTKVLSNGKPIDETVTTTGFRSYTFHPDKGFALNGEWMKVKGVCLHHDAGVLGAEVYKDVWRRRLENLKRIGVNAIRTSHNPQATALYELCDEMGFLVMDEAFDEWEFPKRKWLTGWNVGTPGFQGSYDFFETWGTKDLEDMVKRDRNHISIFAWSIGNEVDYPNDPYSHPILDGDTKGGFTQKIFGGYKKDAPDATRLGIIAKKLAAVVRALDSSRPITAGLAGVAMSNETEYPFALGIAGYNYTESRYKSDHEKYPNRVIFGSENRHDYSAWMAVVNNEHIFGQFLWTGIDYLGESGKWPSRGFYSGLVDFAGFIKPRGYFRQALWSGKPFAYIGTYPISGTKGGEDVLTQSEGKKEQGLSMDAWPLWNYNEGQMVRVVYYTNGAKARLMLNGKQVGETKDYDGKTGIIYWDIPYAAGILKVESMNETGAVVATDIVQTFGKATALRVFENDPSNGQGEIIQVAVQVVDEKGNPVWSAENEITCTVSGNGKLLGLEAGNNTDMGDYTDQKQNCYKGRLIAYIKRTKENADLKINFSASGLIGIGIYSK